MRTIRTAAFTAVCVAMACCCHAVQATTVSGDVSGDWTLRMNPVIATSSLRIPNGYSLRIQAGVSCYLAPGASIVVDGILSVTGADQSPVTIRPANTAGGPWGSIIVSPTGQATLTNCYVRGGGVVAPGELSGMLLVNGPSTGAPQLTLSKCEVSGSASSGVYLNGGSLVANRCSFFGNGGAQPIDAAIHVVTGVISLGAGPDANSIVNGVFGIYNDDVIPVKASGQWWGSASGPQSPDNIPGIGCSASDDVIFGDWVTIDAHPKLGDVDRDGAVAIGDVRILLKVISGIEKLPPGLMPIADVVPDGSLNLRDAMRVARAASGLAPL